MTWFLLAAVSILAGCRAFEPETVVVNKAPETYIIGAPLIKKFRIVIRYKNGSGFAGFADCGPEVFRAE